MGITEDLKAKIVELKQQEAEAKKAHGIVRAELNRNQKALDLLEGKVSKRKYSRHAPSQPQRA